MTKSEAKKAIEIVKSEIKNRSAAENLMSLFKAALSAVPIGGFFASLIDDYIPTRKAQRVESFMSEIAAKFVELQDKIEEKRIINDHFAYIFEQCVRGVAKYPQEEKIECYRAILINAATINDLTDVEQEFYLNLIDTLSPLHIKLLSILNHASSLVQNQTMPEPQTIQTLIPGVDKDVIAAAYSDLYKMQFTRTNTEAFISLVNVELSRIGGRLTSSARKFIEFITLSDKQESRQRTP